MPAERAEWVQRLRRVAGPVLTHLAAGTLKRTMPVEQKQVDRHDCTHLEAFGRTACGVAPWLALPNESLPADERDAHAALRAATLAAVERAVTDGSPDRLNFETPGQPIVDTAFLAHAVVRAPELFHALPRQTADTLVARFVGMRKFRPGSNNWLLFAAVTEAAVHVMGGQHDPMRVDYAVRQHEQWYLGGGVYGDGPQFHGDYYNSFVIQPMLIDTLRTFAPADRDYGPLLPKVLERARRYSELQERSVAPDGSFPPTGRSIAYRCGAFQHLAQMALQHELPASVPPARARGVLGRVIRRTLDAPDTFDDSGWLRIGLAGHQPGLGEPYVSTGSLYLCSAAFLPLGLPPADAFWADADVLSTWESAWSGVDLPADKG